MTSRFKIDNLKLSNFKSLFFDNTSLKQTIIKNTFWLSLSELVSKLLKFFLFIYIARILGATGYGQFSFALAIAGFFLIFSDLGIFKILTREFARRPDKEKDFSALLLLKIFLILISFILILITSLFITGNPLIRILIVILGIEVLLNSFLAFLYAFFRARQKMEYQAWFSIVQTVLVTLFSFLVLFLSPSALNLAKAYLLGTLIVSVFVLFFYNLYFFKLKIIFDTLIWKKYLKLSYPLAAASFFGIIYTSTDSTVMGYLHQFSQTGWYGAAQRIAQICTIPASLITMSFFPVLSKLFRENKIKLQRVWNYYAQIMVILSVPFVVGGITLSQRIIEFVYGSSFLPSVLALQILLVAFAISLFIVPLSQALLVCNHQNKIFWIILAGAILNLILNIILIPKYSLYGASMATLITFILSYFFTLMVTLKYTLIKPLNSKLSIIFLVASLASFVMYLTITHPLINNFHILWIIFIGCLVYLSVVGASKILLKKRIL